MGNNANVVGLALASIQPNPPLLNNSAVFQIQATAAIMDNQFALLNAQMDQMALKFDAVMARLRSTILGPVHNTHGWPPANQLATPSTSYHLGIGCRRASLLVLLVLLNFFSHPKSAKTTSQAFLSMEIQFNSHLIKPSSS